MSDLQSTPPPADIPVVSQFSIRQERLNAKRQRQADFPQQQMSAKRLNFGQSCNCCQCYRIRPLPDQRAFEQNVPNDTDVGKNFQVMIRNRSAREGSEENAPYTYAGGPAPHLDLNQPADI
jgi:hypothetical protein